ncbi:MAG: bifunctional phosphopantothenoylcysteine decarboxylase/phosphopantothenate--cysteine ligase CoaBC [Bilophila sp.]
MDAHLAFRVGQTSASDSASSCQSGWRAPAPRLHLGVTGSIAAYRAPDLVRQWQDAGLAVSVTLTPAAQRFILPLTFSALGAAPVYTSLFGDAEAPSPFAHLEPGQVAQAFVVAPASASTLSRLAQGQADDLLACQALAFRGKLVLAPAMNPAMWHHPATQANVATLRARGCTLVEPGFGRTACGEEGQGRLADLKDIYLAGLRSLAPQDMTGMRVLVTLGPTHEHWDGLRFWTNPSTGVMGAAVAVAAWLRGAEVEAVCGPHVPWLPAGIFRHEVTSALQMFEMASALWPQCDAGVFTAAVADFSPVRPSSENQKFKKSDAPDGFNVRFTPNVDILKTLAASRRPNQNVVGFAAESQDLESSVRGKLVSKKADMVVGNLVCDGFGTANNSVFVADASGREEHWNTLSKPDVAWRLLSWLLSR